MKKLISILLALTLVLSLSVAAFALDTDGSITINGIHADGVYKIYRMLDLESYNEGTGAYSYKVNAAWDGFFALTDTLTYVSIDDAGYVTWKGSEEDSRVAEFAQKALEYAKANGIDPVKSSKTDGAMTVTGTTGKFENLPLGWYLVDSNTGALCGLTTTNPDASVNAKNGTPTVDKQVKEDLGGTWGDSNTADIGQIVEFRTTIHVAAGAENYVLHDEMSKGLTFEQDLTEGRGVTEIKHITSGGVETTLQEGVDKDYTVKTDATGDACDFEVIFSDAFVKTLKANDRIIVYYNAMLNRYAEIGTAGNINESKLEYGEKHYTTEDKTTTYTFSIDIVKTDSSNKLLDGAEFKIYDAATGGNEIKVVELEDELGNDILDDDGKIQYRRTRSDEPGVPIKVVGGKVTVVGFDNGVYYLEETKAPDGYNKLTARKEFTIADGNLDSVFNADIYSTGSGVHVVNKTGSMLPETGAEGTFLFITLGMFTVLATGVLLVTKKRMSMIQE